MSVLWNGSITKEFQPFRVIRQGYPLSPYLFVLCMERLSHIISKAIECGRWKPVAVSQNGPKLSHLFFTNDLVLFAKATIDKMGTIKDCLNEFYTTSRKKVNFSKSMLCFSKGVNEGMAKMIATNSGMQLSSDLGTYLGIPTLHTRKSSDRHQKIIENVNNRLAGWKSKLLSFVGRVTLAKSTLECIPYYAM